MESMQNETGAVEYGRGGGAAAPPRLRLFFHNKSRLGVVLFVGIFHVDRFSIARYRHAVDADQFAITLVALLNRIVADPLQSNHGVSRVALNGIIFAVEFRLITVAVGVRHFQSVGCALKGYGQAVAGDAVDLGLSPGAGEGVGAGGPGL